MENILKVTKALSEANRVRVIYALYLEKELCSCQIAEYLDISISTVSRHMIQLQRGNLVKSRKQGKWTFYSLSDELLNGKLGFLLKWILEECDDDFKNGEMLKLREALCNFPEWFCSVQERKNNMAKKKLLFLCTGNSCRSQMAEAYGKKYLKNCDVYSAGIEKHGLNPYMLKVMKEDGISMDGHYSKTLKDVEDVDFDVVVTVCGHANETCPMYLKKAKIIHKGFEDPAKAQGSEEEIIQVFRKVRDEIKSYVKNELSKIV